MTDSMRADPAPSASDPVENRDPAPTEMRVASLPASRLRPALVVLFGSVLFAACAWYMARTFEWKQIGDLLVKVNVPCLVLGGGLSIVAYWMLRALRWHILLRRANVSVPLFDLYMCTAVCLSLALFTPLQSGEALKVEFLRKYGTMRGVPGYATFLVERVLDLTTILAMACWSLLTVLDILPSWFHAYGLIAALPVLGAGGIFGLRRLRLKGRMGELLDAMRHCVGDPATLVLVLLITFSSWVTVVVSWQVVLYSAGIPLGFGQAVALVSLIALVSVVSLIPGGLGISEVGVFQMLMQFGFTALIAQAGALVLRSFTVAAIAFGIGHLGLWKLVRTIGGRGAALDRTR
jgi:uncharacterized membrane protein YbhN (UPF0104 family)